MKTYHKTTHELKTHPQYFTLIEAGLKHFELRKDDRGYEVDDLLILREWSPVEEEYTGHAICAVITCIVRDGPWLTPGYVAIGMRVLT